MAPSARGGTRSDKQCPQGLVRGPALFNIFAMDSGIEWSFGKSAGDTRLCGAVDMQEGKDPSRFERWAYANLINFNRAKYKTLHMGQGNPDHKYWLDGERIESSSKKGFRVLLNKQLDL